MKCWEVAKRTGSGIKEGKAAVMMDRESQAERVPTGEVAGKSFV